MRVSGKTLVPAVVAVVLAAAGAATVLDSYGTITGTADVQAAVLIDSVDRSKSEVTLDKKTGQEIVSGDEMDLVNVTDGAHTVLNSSIEMSSESKTLTVDLGNVDKIALEIEGTQIDSWTEGSQ